MFKNAAVLAFILSLTAIATSQNLTDSERSTADSQPKSEVINSLGMHFALIKPGTFQMGAQPGEPARDDENLHSVRLTKSFYLGVTEVTVGQMRKFVEENSSLVNGRRVPFRTNAERGGQTFEDGKPGGFQLTNSDSDKWVATASWKTPGWQQDDNYPAAFLSWEDANAFVLWLSKKEKKHYRLPTEAEWEYACRAGVSTAYWWGNEPDKTGKVANVADRSFKKRFPSIIDTMDMDDGYVFTAPVGQYRANNFGLHDMIGNTWEWVADFYDPHLKDDVDPKGPGDGSERIARGGGWGTTTDRCRCAARFHDPPDTRYAGTGFRVALDIEPPVGGKQ
jgi:sulfatase modifying factor 1